VGVLAGVGDRLLGDAQQGELDVGGERALGTGDDQAARR
jgi:hypothetical protein